MRQVVVGSEGGETADKGPLLSFIAWMFYENWISCEGWNDVHLPDGWRIIKARMPIPQVPNSGPERDAEIQRRRSILLSDLRLDPD